jgi:transposase
MKITAVGIDLAKNVFQVHAVDQRGKTALRKQLRREQVTTFRHCSTMRATNCL